MGFLDKLAGKVVSGAAKGVGNAVQNTAERKATEAVQGQIDKTADKIIKTGTESTAQTNYDDGAVDTGAVATTAGGLAGLAGMMTGFANEAAKNIKICPKCQQGAGADKKFCPACGTALPEQTLGAGAACKDCGKQNDIGTKFCAGCGAKLPIALQEEQAAKMRDGNVMQNWTTMLPQYPQWTCGGYDFCLEENGTDDKGRPYYHFGAMGVSQSNLNAYREILKQNGFRTAGEYPSEDALFKRINGVVYCFDSGDPFVDPGHLGVSFGIREPHGGFDYVKPEKKEKKGLFGFFK
jgi:RNA polymerase subunit RPABC4/transcription elongation factor Spt4